MSWSASATNAEKLKKGCVTCFVRPPDIELFFQCEYALGTGEYNASHNAANSQIRLVGAGSGNKKPRKDNPQIDDHVVGRKYPAGFHVSTAVTVFGAQEQTTDVGNKDHRCDGHNQQRLRITAKQKAPANFNQCPSGKDKLEDASHMRRSELHLMPCPTA